MTRQFHIGDKVQRVGRWHGVVVAESFLPNGRPACTIRRMLNVRGGYVSKTVTDVTVPEKWLITSWLADKMVLALSFKTA